MVLAIAAPASAGTLDQQQTESVTSEALLSNQSGAQTFTAGLSGVLDQADLMLGKVGTPPDTVTIEVRTAAAGSPTASVLATAAIPTSAIGTSQSFLPVTFAAPASITAGTEYALVAWSPGSSGNSVGWGYSSGAAPYKSGAAFFSSDPAPPGGSWTAMSSPPRDFAFKTYVAPSPAPSTNLTGICKGQQATIVGTKGHDVLSGTSDRDVMVGLGGNDTLSGLGGDDVICGGPGKDTIKGGDGQDTLLGQKGKDRLKGGPGADFCKGGKGKDTASKCEVEKSL